MRVLIFTFLIFSFSFASDDLEKGKELVNKYNCLSCHDFSQKRTGPSFAEIARKYGTGEEAVEKVAKIIINPPSFMPPFKIPFEQAKAIAKYILIEGSKVKNKKEKKVFDEYIDLDSQFH
jgi:cytochrome c551/c552